MVYTYEQVISFLPHRDPFLFIDSVETLRKDGKVISPGELKDKKDILGIEVTAKYRTKKEHEIFKGHFPGNPILPGVVQVEMMAQATSFVVGGVNSDLNDINLDVALVAINSSKFRKPILPEMDLVIVSRCDRLRGPMMGSTCEIFCNGELMSEASVLATVKF